MNIYQFARLLLEGETLEEKLFEPSSKLIFEDSPQYSLPTVPGRSKKIRFREERIRFPKKENLKLKEKKALALHFFANHELLAIEMMAAALLIYPHSSSDIQQCKKGLVQTIFDEQKHFRLYCNRLNELGYDFGDFPINSFFWRQMKSIKSMNSFIAVMSLTFEAANLDFAHYYQKIFSSFDDNKTAAILETVLNDELNHVKLGVYFSEKWRKDKTLWDYYISSLPFPITPARSMGMHFLPEYRQEAGMSEEFITKLKEYRDDFSITQRKEWKK